MEIIAGERACFTLLAFICLKKQLHWRTNPIGKVRKAFPSLKNIVKTILHIKLDSTY